MRIPVRYDSLICVTWLIHTYICDMTASYVFPRDMSDSSPIWLINKRDKTNLICVTWLVHMRFCVTWLIHMQFSVTWLIHMRFCVTWLIHMRFYVTWLIHMRFCVTWLIHMRFCVTWLIHMRAKTFRDYVIRRIRISDVNRKFVLYESLICVTWFVHVSPFLSQYIYAYINTCRYIYTSPTWETKETKWADMVWQKSGKENLGEL